MAPIQCLRVNIPEDDDAHMVFLVIPSAEVDDEGEETPKWVDNYKAIESHFMGQMQEITKHRTKNEALLRKFPAKPPAAASHPFVSRGYSAESAANLAVATAR